MAQHASPNVTGQMDDRRAHCTIFSTDVVSTGISDSRPMTIPVERALPPDVDIPGEQQGHEEHHLHESGPSESAERHRPGIQEGHFDVEEEEDHRDEVELHRLPLAGVADRWHAALVGGRLLSQRLARAENTREE